MGYLVALDSNLDGEPTWVPDEFEHVFDASERSFFRCAESLELDETVGDVHSMLHEREQAILRSIEGHVLEHQAELCMLSEAIGELDVILALAEVAAVRSNELHALAGRRRVASPAQTVGKLAFSVCLAVALRRIAATFAQL